MQPQKVNHTSIHFMSRGEGLVVKKTSAKNINQSIGRSTEARQQLQPTTTERSSLSQQYNQTNEIRETYKDYITHRSTHA